jgi:TPR repeat protein
MSQDPPSAPDLSRLRHALELLASDPTLAVGELTDLAETGSVRAMNLLGEIYHRGDRVKKDMDKAIYWYQRAGECGLSRSWYYLGMVFQQRKEYDAAIKSLERAANAKYAPAMNLLGIMYFKGQGTRKDLIKGMSFWESAAALGHVYAKRNLGHRLATGRFGFSKIPRGIALSASASLDAWRLAMNDSSSDLLR